MTTNSSYSVAGFCSSVVIVIAMLTVVAVVAVVAVDDVDVLLLVLQ